MGEVLLILQDQIRRYGGSYGVRDPALLSSALAMPSAAFSGEFLHADICQQAAAYAYHLCQNHPFLDGNRRTALAAALVFLDLNGIDISDPSLDLYRLMVGVAQGKKTRSDISSTFRKLSSRKRKQ